MRRSSRCANQQEFIFRDNMSCLLKAICKITDPVLPNSVTAIQTNLILPMRTSDPE